MNEEEIEKLADEQFCDYKGLLCLGHTDEGYLPYNYDEYLSFVEGFKRAFKIISSTSNK